MNDQNLTPFQKGNKFGKGRPKGSLNFKTEMFKFFAILEEIDKQKLEWRNARRRELYKKRKLLDSVTK